MFSIEGRPVSRIEDIPSTVFGVVDENYLRTTGIALMRGRDFSASDGEKTLPVAIVNQAFVKQFFPGVDPIGRRIEVGAPRNLLADDEWMGSERVMVTIAGVMHDNSDQGLSLPVAPQLIGLFRQMPQPVNSGFKDLLVRSNVAPEALEGPIEQQLHALDPRILLSEAESMSANLGELMTVQRQALEPDGCIVADAFLCRAAREVCDQESARRPLYVRVPKGIDQCKLRP